MEPTLRFDSPKITLWGLPVAFALAYLAKLLVLPDFLLSQTVLIFVHELGHAVVCWLSGRFALPLFLPGFGLTQGALNRGGLFLLFMITLYNLLFYYGIKRKSASLVLFTILAYVAQAYFSLLIPENKIEEMILFNGIGAQMIFGAAMVCAFYYRFPDEMRWDFFRIPVLLLGAYCFMHTYLHWISIQKDPSLIPWGSVMSGPQGADGDLNRLKTIHGWSQAKIIETYLRVGKLCLVAMGGHFMMFGLNKKAASPIEDAASED